MKLSEFELDVMQIFWEQGPCSASAAHKVISESKKTAYTTVKTIVDRLEEKGAIKRVGNEGRSIVYSAAVKQEAMSQSVLPDFLKRFFGGNSRNLVAHLIDDEKLSEDDIEYLQHYLANKKSKK
ncbi:BlaI/MecI/CopY family transcriptional regulator [Algibacillus agarilyticus]|uniref:BlaI/MecI/CopY family transcriptional regulator n=1 Tax=Algibacillus agarilyticus TaxID=2234133 RepID=UPI000DCFFBA1|nr:BlaI/MecI/CopY family transcriptional regulator [Algibacillus agarilyticus]